MKGNLLSLFIFAIFALLSSALPADKEKEGVGGLLEPQNPNARDKFLQKKKPPVKIPLPTYGTDYPDDDDDPKPKSKGKKSLVDDEYIGRSFADRPERSEHGKRGRGRGRHLVAEDRGRRKGKHLAEEDKGQPDNRRVRNRNEDGQTGRGDDPRERDNHM